MLVIQKLHKTANKIKYLSRFPLKIIIGKSGEEEKLREATLLTTTNNIAESGLRVVV